MPESLYTREEVLAKAVDIQNIYGRIYILIDSRGQARCAALPCRVYFAGEAGRVECNLAGDCPGIPPACFMPALFSQTASTERNGRQSDGASSKIFRTY